MKGLEKIANLPEDKVIVEELIRAHKVKLEKQGHVGRTYEAQLRDEIDEYWDEMTTQVGELKEEDKDKPWLIAGILALLTQKVEKATREAYEEMWSEARGEDMDYELEMGDVNLAIAEAMKYFKNFMRKFQGELDVLTPEEMLDKIDKRRSRAIMYAGGVWALYNLVKTYGVPKTSLWKWDGPVDSASCACCVGEMGQGARPLYAITIYPGSCSCVTNCRHELVEVIE